MSGGLDSPLLAATAQQLKRECGSSGEVFAFTVVYDRLIPDQERHYSALVARYLGIQQHIYMADGPDAEELWSQAPEPCTEPAYTPWAANLARDQCRRMMDLSRVYLYGEGPDNALYLERMAHFRFLIRRRRWVRLSKDLCLFMWLYRRKPLLSTLLRMIRQARAKSASMPALPGWLNPEFSARLRLQHRWRETRAATASSHPHRPVGYASLQSPLWQGLFEAYDSAYGQFPLEFRHPYLNLPLLRFLLRLPALPWCHAKYILRVAGRGLLPNEIVRRPKAPLAGFPDVEMVKRHGLPALFPATRLRDYLLPDKVGNKDGAAVQSLYADLRAVSLSHWLRDLERFPKNTSEESFD
jgi:asparagine synthase (glutamine-hydrolysing)